MLYSRSLPGLVPAAICVLVRLPPTVMPTIRPDWLVSVSLPKPPASRSSPSERTPARMTARLTLLVTAMLVISSPAAMIGRPVLPGVKSAMMRPVTSMLRTV